MFYSILVGLSHSCMNVEIFSTNNIMDPFSVCLQINVQTQSIVTPDAILASDAHKLLLYLVPLPFYWIKLIFDSLHVITVWLNGFKKL